MAAPKPEETGVRVFDVGHREWLAKQTKPAPIVQDRAAE
jgi:hypothetical protein